FLPIPAKIFFICHTLIIRKSMHSGKIFFSYTNSPFSQYTTAFTEKRSKLSEFSHNTVHQVISA
ncbi:MAG: hypothetical protein KAR32_07160, partial [Candidatus Omnitrophica bacterium]|nr:hypothetical protein [Candidatus Omnitrophota bacterium]